MIEGFGVCESPGVREGDGHVVAQYGNRHIAVAECGAGRFRTSVTSRDDSTGPDGSRNVPGTIR